MITKRIITSRLSWFLESNKLISPTQASYRKWIPTSQDTLLSQSVKDALHQIRFVLAVFVEFEATFDKVWQLKCIQKLQNLSVCSNMLSWIRNVLSRCAGRLGDSVFNFKQNETSSVINPILFKILIDALLGILTSDGLTSAALFTDDHAIWCCTPKREQFYSS
ncbi:putative RNA-directed DNA polymerase from transposon X-element [Trichonephila clavipes]|nr:putative RNA-directed DNA polymerase from transposon X-element [Trichonephila clavipes]